MFPSDGELFERKQCVAILYNRVISVLSSLVPSETISLIYSTF